MIDTTEKLENWLWKLTLALAFLIPIKLSLAYAALIPLNLLWCYINRKDIPKQISKIPYFISVPLVSWISFALLSSAFGVNPGPCIIKILRLLFATVVIAASYQVAQKRDWLPILVALLAGQSIASAYTIISPLLPVNFNSLLIGTVTESGQLSLTTIVASGLFFFLYFKELPTKEKFSKIALFLTNLILYTTLGLHSQNLDTTNLTLLCLATAIFTIVAIWFSTKENQQKFSLHTLLLTIMLPLLFAALLINLKRGPWLGVLIAGAIMLSIFYRKWIFPVLITIIATFIFVTPIRSRIQDSYEDFFIAGGRSIMWEIGTELSLKYPLGIGFNNSALLREFDPDIPPMHTHFHSNFINILVETGWLGLLTFMWWIFSILKCGFRNKLLFPESLMLFSISAAILSWQIAGLVEYNFGDSEVLLLVFLLLGVMGTLANKPQTQ